MRQPLLKHTHIIKLGRILNMMYKPAELAEEIEINIDTIYRSYLPAGLPCSRDHYGHIWIHGPSFVKWAKETVAKHKKARSGLQLGQAWCMKCNQAVELIDPIVKPINRYLEMLQAHCPHCGKKVNRAKARELPQ